MTAPESPTDVSSEMESSSLLPILAAMLRRAYWIIGWGGVSALAVAIVLLILPRSYSSQSAFVAQSRRMQSSLTGLAAQFGLNVPGTEASQSPQFYADYVRSRPVLAAAASRAYRTTDGDRTIAAMYSIDKATPELTEDAVLEKLSKQVEAAANVRTGVVRLVTRLQSPEAAQELNRELLDLLNRFNQETRQSQANAERLFTERRYTEASHKLRTSEDELQRFLQRNRDLRSSPQLQFEAERLQRTVAMEQEIVTSLVQSLEQARIEEVRDTPVITTIEAPSLPAKPDSRGLIALSILAFVVGTLLSSAYVVARDVVSRMGAGGEHARLLADAWGQAKGRILFWKRGNAS